MKQFKKSLLLFVAVIIFSACSSNFYKHDNESKDDDSQPYYVNYLFGDDAGRTERITIPKSESSDENTLENIAFDCIKLNDKQKNAYKQIYDGIKNYETQIKIDSGAIKQEDVNDFLSCITSTAPEIHHLLENYGLYIDGDRYVTELEFNYSCSKEQGDSELYHLKREIKNIVDKTSTLSDLDKIKYFHDHIVLNCKYDETNSKRYTAYGCLIEGKAVCEGYSKAFSMLCNQAGIPCINVVGETNDKGIIVSHMWNMVMINNNWYHVDTTWDDPKYDDDSEFLEYDYFTLTDEEIFKDHSIDYNKFWEYPKAISNDDNYFIKYGLYVKNDDNTSAIIEKAIINGIKNSNEFVNLKFQSKEKYDEAINKYFDKNDDEIFNILKKVQKKSKIKLKNENYSYSSNDITWNINIKLEL